MSFNRTGGGRDSRYPNGYQDNTSNVYGTGTTGGGMGTALDMFNTNQAYEAVLQNTMRTVVDAQQNNAQGSNNNNTNNVNNNNNNNNLNDSYAGLGGSGSDFSNYVMQQQQQERSGGGGGGAGRRGGGGGGGRNNTNSHRIAPVEGEALVAAALEDYYRDERNQEPDPDEDDDDDHIDDSEDQEKEVPLGPPQKRRRNRSSGGTGPVKKAGYPFKYFLTLEERLISKQTGKPHQRLCVCKYCQMEYEEYLKAFKLKKIPNCPTVPRKIVRGRRELIQHLRRCSAFTKFGPTLEEMAAEDEADNKKEPSPDDEEVYQIYKEDSYNNSDDDEDSDMPKKKKSRKLSSASAITVPQKTEDRIAQKKNSGEFPFIHFITLAEKYVSKSSGKQNNQRLCICIYCQTDADQYRTNRPPKKIMRARRDLCSHLRNCTSYKNRNLKDYVKNFGFSEVKNSSSSSRRSGAVTTCAPYGVSEIDRLVAKRLEIQGMKMSDKSKKIIMQSNTSSSPPAMPSTGGSRLIISTKRAPIEVSSAMAKDMRSSRALVQVAGSVHPTALPRVSTEAIETSLVELIVDNGLAMNIVEKQSFRRFVFTLLPTQQVQALPRSAFDLFRLIKERAIQAENGLDKALNDVFSSSGKGTKHRAGLIITNYHFDGAVPSGIKGDESYLYRNMAVFRISAGDAVFTMYPPTKQEPKTTSVGAVIWDKDKIESRRKNRVQDEEGIMNGDDKATNDDEGEDEEQVEAKDVEDKCSEHDVVTVARAWENLLISYKDKYNLSYLVANESKWFPESRRILALRHPHVIFNRCWAHQILIIMVKALISPSSPDDSGSTMGFVETFQDASNVVRLINGSKKWSSLFRNEVKKMYGKSCSSFELIENDVIAAAVFDENSGWWYSTQANLASLLRVRSAAQAFASKYEAYPDFSDNYFLFKDDEFWSKVAKSEQILRPLCNASGILRQKGNSMAHVMLIMLNFARHFVDCTDDEANEGSKSAVILDLECRWKREENPLFFLSFALHPAFRDTAVEILKASYESDGGWMTHKNPLSIPRLVKAGKFYYMKFKLLINTDKDKSKQELKIFAKLLWQWLNGKDFDVSDSVQNENAVEWWDENGMELRYLSNFAKFLLDAPVQSATCEGLFKDLGRNTTSERSGDLSGRHISAIRDHMQVLYGSKEVSVSKWTVLSSKEYAPKDGDNEKNTNEQTDKVDKEQTFVKSNHSKIEGIDELDCWNMLYSRVVPGNDREEYYVDDGKNGDGKPKKLKSDGDGVDDEDGNQSEDEDSYEVQPDPLPPLLEVKQAKYPQENQHYFKGKRYVRNDKYSLRNMIFHGIKLPSLDYFMDLEI